MTLTTLDFVLIGLAAVAAGLVNALAGGGTLITFPMLTAIGIPAVVANLTNTVALCPGYLGATFAQSKDLKDQKKRLWILLPVGAVGGIIGGLLLFVTSEKLFRQLVPILILLACVLLSAQEPLRAWLTKRAGQENNSKKTSDARPILDDSSTAGYSRDSSTAGYSGRWTALPVGLAAIYGGYFGAGLSVIVLAVLGLILDDTLTRLNALKQAVAFSANIAAAILFILSGRVLWPAALVMAVGALLGGSIGGRLAGRIKPTTLRYTVVAIGVVVAIIYLLRG